MYIYSVRGYVLNGPIILGCNTDILKDVQVQIGNLKLRYSADLEQVKLHFKMVTNHFNLDNTANIHVPQCIYTYCALST